MTIMRNNLLLGLTLVLTSFLITSCGDDDPVIVQLEAGTITGGPYEFVVDGVADNITTIALSGDGEADNKSWVITDVDGLILGLPGTLTDLEGVDFDGAGAGVCFVYHIVYSDGLDGLAAMQNLSNISGTFDLSNRIRVSRIGINAGVLSGGPFNFVVDGEPDMVSGITVSGNEDASNTSYVITDAERNILGTPATLSDLEGVDFDGAGAGVCFIYRITYADGLEGLSMGNNLMTGLSGASFAFSNALTTVREEGVQPTTFRITLTNTVNYLAVELFNTLDGATEAGPGPNANDSYSITFKATPGTYVSFATMNAMSNDWFYAPDGDGIALYTGNGDPVTGDVTGQVMLWDSGTEEENPLGFASLGEAQIAHEADDNTAVRLVESSIIDDIGVELAHANDEFTLTITNRAGGAGGVVITPGLLVVHAQDYPLFSKGYADRGNGLREIAEDGNPQVLHDWFTAEGTGGAPLRLSSSMTPFAPGAAYVFAGTESDPLFVQGQAASAESGLEKLAEDGGADVTVAYLNGLDGVTAVAADQMAPVGPGQEMTFEISAKPGYKFGFATMFIQSNDWFVSFNNNGVELFNDDETPKSGTDYSVETYLYDAGTEEDQAVGTGADQAPRQSGADTGAVDDDTSVRRVTEIDDVQFGKGTITSTPGVTAFEDARGGYNIIKVDIQPL